MKNLSLFCLATLLTFSSTFVKGSELPRLVIDSGGHMGFIRDVVFTRDGRFLVSGGDDKVVRVWNKETGKTVRTIRGEIGEGDDGKINALALSPDDKYLAVGGHFPGDLEDRGAIRIYDFDSGELVGLLKGHRGAVLALAFSADGRRLISGGDFNDKTARIWSVETPQHLKQLHVLTGHRDGIFSVGFSIDGERAASSSRDTQIMLWDANKGLAITTINRGRNEQVDAIKFSPDGRYLASGSRAGRIVLWNERTGDFVRELGRQAGTVTTLSFSPDSRQLLTAAENGKCLIFQLSSSRLVRFKHETSIEAGSFLPDGKTLLTAGGGTTGIILREPSRGLAIRNFTSEGQAIQEVGFARDGQSIAFTGMREAQNRLLKQSILLKEGTSYKVSLDGAVRDQTKYFRAVTSVNGNLLQASRGQTTANRRVQYLWKLYLIRGTQKKLLATDVSDYRHVLETLTHDGRYAISGAERGYLTRYQTVNPTPEKGLEFVGHTNRILSLAVSPDSKTLLSGSNDQTMKLWDIESGRNLLTIFVGDDDEWVAWTPEGYYTSSLHGDRYIGWHINQGPDKSAKFYTAAQFQKDFYRPDIVAEYLSTRDIQLAVERANDRRKAAGFSSNVMSATDITGLLPPTVSITSPKDRESTVTEETLTLKADVYSARLPITNIKVLLNGSPQGTFAGNSNSSHLELKLKLDPGLNTLTIIAFNKQSYSEPEIRKINYTPARAGNKLDQYQRTAPAVAYVKTLFSPVVEASNFVMRSRGLQGTRPEVVVSSPSDFETTVEDENLTVKVTALSFTSPITEINVTVNGKPNAFVRLRTEAKRQDVELQVKLEPGSNDLAITASDKESSSEPQTRRVICTNCIKTGKPILIFLGIGISKYRYSTPGSEFQDLSFAHKDVDAVAKAFETQNSLQPENARVFSKVISRVIPNEQADKKAILEGLVWMNNEAQKNSNNVHVLYLAGHGGMDTSEKYYFFSRDHQPNVPMDNNDVSWSVVMDYLTDTRGKAVIFIDTCHAGASRGATSLATLYRAYHESFVSVFTFIASDASGVSVEHRELQHGAFTKAVLDGLNGAADTASGDAPKDAKVDVDELGLYIKRRVTTLASNQRAGYYNDTGFESLVLFSNPPRND